MFVHMYVHTIIMKSTGDNWCVMMPHNYVRFKLEHYIYTSDNKNHPTAIITFHDNSTCSKPTRRLPTVYTIHRTM